MHDGIELSYPNRENGVCFFSSSNAQRTAISMAFKMSLVLEKVSKVMSCEIRAQAKKRRNVSHFKFIKTAFVLLTYLFPFSRQAYNLLAPSIMGLQFAGTKRGSESVLLKPVNEHLE